jgi:hypothetical protein
LRFPAGDGEYVSTGAKIRAFEGGGPESDRQVINDSLFNLYLLSADSKTGRG